MRVLNYRMDGRELMQALAQKRWSDAPNSKASLRLRSYFPAMDPRSAMEIACYLAIRSLYAYLLRKYPINAA